MKPAASRGRTIVRSGCWIWPRASSARAVAHDVGALGIGQQRTHVVAGQDEYLHAGLQLGLA